MALKIRMQRGGKTHSPRYRLVVAESSSPRDGKFVEILGNYNPQAHKNEKELDLKMDRIDYWMGVGAKPSDTVRTMINRARREASAEGEPKPEAAESAKPEEAAPAAEAAPVETPAPAEPVAEAEATKAAPAEDSPEETVEAPEDTPEKA